VHERRKKKLRFRPCRGNFEGSLASAVQNSDCGLGACMQIGSLQTGPPNRQSPPIRKRLQPSISASRLRRCRRPRPTCPLTQESRRHRQHSPRCRASSPSRWLARTVLGPPFFEYRSAEIKPETPVCSRIRSGRSATRVRRCASIRKRAGGWSRLERDGAKDFPSARTRAVMVQFGRLSGHPPKNHRRQRQPAPTNVGTGRVGQPSSRRAGQEARSGNGGRIRSAGTANRLAACAGLSSN
jgi:hypothetical protein